MIEYIPISKNLSQVIGDLANQNGGISLMATEECSDCQSACADACQYVCENGGQTIATHTNTIGFSWQYTPVPNETINISAKEWNEFIDAITFNLSHEGKAVEPEMVAVEKNDPIKASNFNSLKTNIDKIDFRGPTGCFQTPITIKTPNISLIEADDFNALVSNMNNAMILNYECCELGQKQSD